MNDPKTLSEVVADSMEVAKSWLQQADDRILAIERDKQFWNGMVQAYDTLLQEIKEREDNE